MDFVPQPSTSSAECSQENTQDLEELKNTQGINIWSETQETLEQQALHEIEVFAKETAEVEDADAKNQKEIAIKPTLDINEFIRRQEELKKRQDHAKSLQISERSKLAAARISKHAKKRKLKKQPSNPAPKKVKADEATKRGQDSDYAPSDEDCCDGVVVATRRRRTSESGLKIERVKDDGAVSCYRARLEEYYKRLEEERVVLGRSGEEEEEFCVVEGGLKVPVGVWGNLYSYQQDGVKWLWKTHQNLTGALLGDEMGLGKTVQIIVFLYALNYSRISIKQSRYIGLGPTLIVSPATVIHQWVQHFHEWAPEFRVAVLHQSGTFTGNKTKLIKEINKDKGILITTYIGVLKFKGVLLEHNWHYIVLDEGHKIRNPGAKISVAVKEFRTPHRVMLTGSPMQNNLQELWSLFDFVVPGMLGTLPTFLEHFAHPIIQGGYSNATPMQEATALSMATALKDMISRCMLRRVKSEVKKAIALPNKSEQVLFCSLTDEQRDLYKGFLLSEHVSMILGRGGKNWFSQNHVRANVLVAIMTLRKICNHPDLYLNEFDENKDNFNDETPIDYYKRSGKMIVVSALLKIWKKQNHRVLLFTQSRAMILIFEDFLKQQGYKFLKMDGSTSIGSRQALIDRFNQDNSCFVFLLTTRVGGLGVNLTGANRVIIYDPDWNPATDTQARERAWRIGQEKQVTIYRLLSAGTIEEKMYQRQVWKQLLSNKVLIDPKTHKFFKSSDLHDLFSLQEQTDDNPETANIFHNSRVNMQERLKEKPKKKKVAQTEKIEFSEDKIQAMKNLAQQIAKSIAPKKTSTQIELEEERLKKLEEKSKLKTLTPTELRELNRKRLEKIDDGVVNQLDDFDTDVSFSKALEVTEKTAQLYTEGKTKKDVEKEVEQYTKLVQEVAKKKPKKTASGVHNSGKVDGEVVEGVVKKEIKKRREKESTKKSLNQSQDDYVLNKLFNKKGVHTALQHDVIVECKNSQQSNLKIRHEAKMKAELALEAIRKTRLNNWTW